MNYLYRYFFGKDFGPVWQQFAKENGGEYAPVIDDRVLVPYKNFTITFDAFTNYTIVGGSAYKTEYTRGLVEFNSSDNFKLLITQQVEYIISVIYKYYRYINKNLFN